MGRLLDQINFVFSVLAGASLCFMILVTLFDIGITQVTGRPYGGTYDVVRAFLVATVFFSLPYIFRHESNISVTLIDSLLPPRVLGRVVLVARLATLVFVLVIGWSVISPFYDSWFFGDQLFETGIPVWLIWIPILIGIATSSVMVISTFSRHD